MLMPVDISMYEAARNAVAGIEWEPEQDRRYICIKRCPAAKAHVLVARPREAKPAKLPSSWPVLLYLDRERAGIIQAATLSGALGLGDAWMIDQLVAIQRRELQPG